MRRMQGFQAAPIRPFRRLFHACRHIAAASVHAAAPVTSAHPSHRTNSRTLFTQPPPPSTKDATFGEACERNGCEAVGPHALHEAPSIECAASPSPAPPDVELSLLTLEKVDAFVRRHEHLCEHVFLFSTSPSLAATYTSTGTLFSQPSVAWAEGGPSHHATSSAMRDGEHRHSPRAFHATASEVGEIRSMLDRMSQEPQVLGALTDRQRHRLVTNVCRIGYVVGLHRRCCALYVDTVLLAAGVGEGAGGSRALEEARIMQRGITNGNSASVSSPSTPTSASSSAAAAAAVTASFTLESSLMAIPEFVMDAAGEAADLPTLELCLSYATRAMKQEALTSQVGAADTLEMGPGWLTALHVFVQCVRVALQRGWQGDRDTTAAGSASTVKLKKAIFESPARAEGGKTPGRMDFPGDVVELLSSNDEGEMKQAYEEHDAAEEACWLSFTTRVLHTLRIVDAAAFFSVTLRSARYHYMDCGGAWSAAQAAIYARCFRYWLGEVEEEEEKPSVTKRAQYTPRTSSPRATSRIEKDSSRLPTLSTTTTLPVVQLSFTALVLLLRTAVAARQHDIAEWTTLYVDACIDNWATDGRLHNTPPSHTAVKTDSSLSCSAAAAQLDALFVWYLRYLQQSNQRRRACRWLRRLRTRQQSSPLLANALQSLSVLRVAARLAGEELDADLALWCLQLCLSDVPGLSPSHGDIFACLCAFARCGLPTFDMVLQSLQRNGLLTPTAEELLYVRLLHARRSVHWRAAWEECMAPYVVQPPPHATRETRFRDGPTAGEQWSHGSASGVATTVSLRLFPSAKQDEQAVAAPHGSPAVGSQTIKEEEEGRRFHYEAAGGVEAHQRSHTTVFSTRVMHQILLILQEGEHPAFMLYYRTFLLTFSEHVTVNDRARWALLALVWASMQHGCAPVEDLVYIVREVDQLMELQADDHSVRNAVSTNKAKSASSSSSPRPLPIAADLHRSLQRRWAVLYQHYPPSWWTNAGLGTTQSGNLSGPPPPSLDPALAQRMASRARTSTAASSLPAFARFLRRRHRLPVTSTSAADMLVSSVRHTARGNDVGETSVCLFSFPQRASEALHQQDRELWAAYVASSVTTKPL